MNGRWLALAVIVVVGWGGLELMLRQMQIGDHARSPQRLELAIGGRALVGGGKAGLTFLEAPFLRSALFRVKCKAIDRRIQLVPGKETDEICGVRLRLIDFVPGGKVDVEVAWGELPPPATMPAETSSPSPHEVTTPDAPGVDGIPTPTPSPEVSASDPSPNP